MKKSLTIFTPTYNRMKELKKLYKSLVMQENKNFIWLVIDDGSTDGTKEYIKSIAKEKKISIKYLHKQNGGKMSTFSTALKKCTTKYLCCVDSDDFLNKNDINIIYDEIGNNEKKDILGWVFPRKSKKCSITKLKQFNYHKIDIMDLKFLTDKNYETTIVFIADKIRNVQIKTYNNEKFISEEIFYNELSTTGKFIYVNKEVVSSEYLNDGLTNSLYKNYCKNFKSTVALFNSRYQFLKKYSFYIREKNRVKTLINLNALCLAKGEKVLKNSPNPLFSIILLPFSFYWKRKKYER